MRKASLFLVLMAICSVVFAAEGGDANDALQVNWDDVGSVLVVFLVLSVVFESALTPIFNWRIFLLHFEGKGVKVPLTVAAAFIVFWAYDLDIVARLMTALGHDQEANFGGRVLTAFLIAGGSDGIFRIFSKLGIRNPTERKEKAEEARKQAQQGQGTE